MNTSHFAFSRREGSSAFKAFPAVCTNEIKHAARVLSRYRDARRTRILRIRLRLTVRVKKHPSQIDSEKECLEGFLPMIFPGSIELGACRDVVIHHQKMQLFFIAVLLVVDCGKQHATGIDAHHLPRREIGDGDACFADQFFRLIVSMNTGKNRSGPVPVPSSRVN